MIRSPCRDRHLVAGLSLGTPTRLRRPSALPRLTRNGSFMSCLRQILRYLRKNVP
jgi:hypothetical protein